MEKENKMYSFKIKSKSGKLTEGLSVDLATLEDMIAKKIEFDKIDGHVEIFSNKKIVKEYDI